MTHIRKLLLWKQTQSKPSPQGPTESAYISMNTGKNLALIHRDAGQATVPPPGMSSCSAPPTSFSLATSQILGILLLRLLLHFFLNMMALGINLFLSFPFPFLVMHSFLLSFSRQLTISHHGYLGWSLIRKFTYLTRISSILASFCITTHNMSSVSFKKISLFWYTDQFPFLMKETE